MPTTTDRHLMTATAGADGPSTAPKPPARHRAKPNTDPSHRAQPAVAPDRLAAVASFLQGALDRITDDAVNWAQPCGDVVLHIRAKPSGRYRARIVQEGMPGAVIEESHHGTEPDNWPGLEDVGA